MNDAELDAIRAMMRTSLDGKRLSRLAEEVGVSSSGVRTFLGGATPGREMERKVREWSRRHARGDGRTRQEVLVDELLETVPAEARPAIRPVILRLLSTAGAPAAHPVHAPDPAAQPQIVYIDLRSSP